MELVNLLFVGYFLWLVILLNINATTNRINEPVRTGDKTYI